jgi:hypothetical protein
MLFWTLHRLYGNWVAWYSPVVQSFAISLSGEALRWSTNGITLAGFQIFIVLFPGLLFSHAVCEELFLVCLFLQYLFNEFCIYQWKLEGLCWDCRYASLYFCMCVDTEDNELETLEIIHHYVEILDRYFGNVSLLSLHNMNRWDSKVWRMNFSGRVGPALNVALIIPENRISFV